MPARVPAPLPDVTLHPPRPALDGRAANYSIRGAGRHLLTPSRWTAALTHAQRDIAQINQHAGEIDVRFFHAQDEAAFLNAIATLRQPDQRAMTLEAAVMELLITRVADADGGMLIGRAPDGTWRAQLHVRPSPVALPAEVLLGLSADGMTELYFPGEGWRGFELLSADADPLARTDADALALKDACVRAMRLLDVSAGERVELFEIQQNAMFELGALARAVLDDIDDPAEQELSHCVMVCVALLAALGTTLPVTRAGKLAGRAQQMLADAVEDLYPGVSATLDDLAQPETDTCVHHDLLDALVRLQLMMGPPSWRTAAERGAAQREILRTLVSLLRVLQGVTDIDIRAVLRQSAPT